MNYKSQMQHGGGEKRAQEALGNLEVQARAQAGQKELCDGSGRCFSTWEEEKSSHCWGRRHQRTFGWDREPLPRPAQSRCFPAGVWAVFAPLRPWGAPPWPGPAPATPAQPQGPSKEDPPGTPPSCIPLDHQCGDEGGGAWPASLLSARAGLLKPNPSWQAVTTEPNVPAPGRASLLLLSKQLFPPAPLGQPQVTHLGFGFKSSWFFHLPDGKFVCTHSPHVLQAPATSCSSGSFSAPTFKSCSRDFFPSLRILLVSSIRPQAASVGSGG